MNIFQNREIATEKLLEELIRTAGNLQKFNGACEEPDRDENEAAFFPVLAANECAIRAMGSDELKDITATLVEARTYPVAAAVCCGNRVMRPYGRCWLSF